ncbi:Catecholate siderophore receptor OS=Castellaniella defragrans OX=75697 GN=HNR28_002483 PE=3 SV=1 [Castellaniella defragrans]
MEDGRKDSLDVDRGNNKCPNGVGAAGDYTCTSLYAPNPRIPG